MRRWLVFALCVVLPLQMGWAAMHIDSPTHQHGHQHGHQHQHPVASHPDEAATGSAASGTPVELHSCCGAGHACHGLHGVVAPFSASLRFLGGAGVFNPREQHLHGCDFVFRHERPQWSAA